MRGCASARNSLTRTTTTAEQIIPISAYQRMTGSTQPQQTVCRSDITTPLVELCRRIIVGEGKSWALFEAGTCVIFAGARPSVAVWQPRDHTRQSAGGKPARTVG
jgi:hypothetical protein